MKRARTKAAWRLFLYPKAVVSVVLPAAIICLLSSMVAAGHTKPEGRVTLLSAARQAGDGPVLSGGRAEQPRQSRTVRMRVTAYCPCSKCCGEYSDGQTATGHKITPGDAFVAADSEYAFGTQMIVAGYNNGLPVKVLDRGGAIRGNRLDVFFNSHQEALNWGVRYIDVKVYTGAGGT